METINHRVVDAAGFPCGVTMCVPPDEGRAHRGAILYLHGGGLLYGERDDLPRPYVDLFLEHGYSLVCADYPLAPEAPLVTIEASVDALWWWFSHARGGPIVPFRIYFLQARSRTKSLSRTKGGKGPQTLAG